MKRPGNLLTRLAAIETRSRPQGRVDHRTALADKLDSIGERLRGDDLADSDRASPAERVALAFERGDGAFAQALLLNAAKREEMRK